MKRFQVSRTLWISLLVMLAAAPALAQSNAEVNSAVQFNFSNPGARSLGFGGAFIGLADDATAAYTNPAGLTNLSKPEVSFEGRYFLYRNDFLDSGHAFGAPTGRGTDTIAGEIRSRTHDVTKSFSFLSFVYPQEHWAVAVYRHELADFQTKFQTNGAFFGPQNNIPLQRFFPVQAQLDLKIIDYGASVAVRFGGFSLGLGATSSQYVQTTRVTRFDVCFDTNCTRFYDKASYATPREIDGVDGSASEHITVNAGLLWKASRQFSVGAVYRQGPKFHNQAFFETTTDFGQTTGTFHVPDAWGIGVTVRPTDFFTASFDFNRVLYSQLTKEFVDIFAANGPALTKDYRVDDGSVYRLGLQYVVPLGANVLALRAGAWRDPDHRVRFTGQVLPSDDTNTAAFKAGQILLFRPGKNEYHYTGGLGFTLGEHLQLDAAADISTSVRTGALSAVVRY
jgi:long-subunit fatty acid transport protein